MAGVAPKRNVFLRNNFADVVLPNLKYQLRNEYPPLTKCYHLFVTHVLYHFCDMSLITACGIFCNLKFHVLCTCTFFGDSICLLTNRKMLKIAGESDWFIYCIDMWLLTLLFSLQYLSESCFGNDKFLLPNPWVVLFFNFPTFSSHKSLFTQPFSLRCHPAP
jgi:hypothetical protein